MATTFEVLYLGSGPEIDTTEGNVLSEDANLLLGNTCGSAGAPLGFGSQRTLSPISYSGGTTNMYDIDNTLSNDTFSIDGGPAQTFDGLAVYSATLTYTDGTPDATITAVVFQDTAGHLYLAPESSANSDYTAMIAAPVESITLNSLVSISSGRLLADRQFTDFICYAAGTRILTEYGKVPVEKLAPGDRVVTLDRGLQPIRWTNSSEQPLENTAEDKRPVLIEAGALGPSVPKRDLVVSPQHRILIGGQQQLPHLSDTEALASAKTLTSLRRIRHMNGKRQIQWVHFACDRHEVVRANGCWSESLLLGAMALRAMGSEDRQTVARLFEKRKARRAELNGPPARNLLRAEKLRSKIKSRRNDARVGSGRSNLPVTAHL